MPGKYYDDLTVGQRIVHANSHTITEAENLAFCEMTANTQPLHIDKDYAAETPFGRRIVNGILTMGLVVGLSVEDLTSGTILANLGYDEVAHPHPVFHGDTISSESEVLEMRESKSRPDRGIVRLKQTGRNQDGAVVVELQRSVMFLKRPGEDN